MKGQQWDIVMQANRTCTKETDLLSEINALYISSYPGVRISLIFDLKRTYVVCSKSSVSFEIVRRLNVLAMLAKLCLRSGVLPNYHPFCHVILL
jgi:hypothetical protein